jgi:large exoprotein involved in heme utilization and adhesion
VGEDVTKDDAIVAASIIYGRGENGNPARAGDVNITATDTLSVTNSVVFSEVGSRSVGNGGTINIDAPKVSLDNGASLITQVRAGGIGNGGDINIKTGSLSATGGSQVVASTFGRGNAGNVEIKASDTVSFDGTGSNRFGINVFTSGNDSYLSGVFSSVEPRAVGNGGGINITTRSLRVTGGALLSARNLGRGNAGNLDITANSVLLDNKGQVIAETASGEGGNIKLQVEDLLLMRRNSLISAQAFNNGNGGNITIKPGLIVAVPTEDSDIVADAEQGNGGRINITTQGIFGLEFRQQRTPNSEVTASSKSGISGTVNITRVGVDPSQGLAALPANLVDQTNQIDQGCSASGANRENKFTVSGRGGLPSTPNELLSPDMVQDDFGTLATGTQTRTDATPSPRPTNSPKQLVEAQGWIIGSDGKVILTTTGPNATPQQGWQTPANCQASQTSSNPVQQ